MTSSSTLNPANLPGSYADRNDEAHRLFNQGELDQAAAICQRIVDRISRLPEQRRAHGSPLHDSLLAAFILLAEIHAKQGDWPALDAVCKRAQQLHPVYTRRWAVEPFMLRIQYGQPADGIHGLQALAEAHPNSFYFWRTLAQAAQDVDDFDLAMTASDHAAHIERPDEDIEDDDLVAFHLVRFKLFQRRGEWHEAASEWLSACDLDNEMEEMRESVVRMFLGAGLYDDALDHVDDELLTPILADYYRAWIANQRGDQVRARYLWRLIVDKDHGDDDNALVRALALCWLRQPDAALALLLEELSYGGPMSMAHALALALAWAMHGDAAAARANVKLAAKRNAAATPSDLLLPALEWIDFEQLVEDEAIKAELRPYFEAPRQTPP